MSTAVHHELPAECLLNAGRRVTGPAGRAQGSARRGGPWGPDPFAACAAYLAGGGALLIVVHPLEEVARLPACKTSDSQASVISTWSVQHQSKASQYRLQLQAYYVAATRSSYRHTRPGLTCDTPPAWSVQHQ